jgi:hypothetical protein
VLSKCSPLSVLGLFLERSLQRKHRGDLSLIEFLQPTSRDFLDGYWVEVVVFLASDELADQQASLLEL